VGEKEKSHKKCLVIFKNCDNYVLLITNVDQIKARLKNSVYILMENGQE
jgi:hypothetical protein